MATESPHCIIMGKTMSPPFVGVFDPILFILAGNENMHKIAERLKIPYRLIMGKCCPHASSFIFDRIISKVADNQDRHKSSDEFDFGPDQTTHFGVTFP